ncbi:MAG: hypothetical protein PVH31_05940 [Ectothiorhodospiraceae bacterium]|jgi:tetratricopeptide (TPR) repeat protein
MALTGPRWKLPGRLPWVALILTGIVACASVPPPADPLQRDPRIADAVALARDAFQRKRFDQAVLLYQRALSRAYASDDATAQAAVGYELALTEYRRYRYRRAVDLAESTNARLQRRGLPERDDVRLVQAWALYQSGDVDRALELARGLGGVRGDRADAQPVALRATVLAAFIAADRQDADALQKLIAALPPPEDPVTAADTDELTARLLALRGDHARASERFLRAVEGRRDSGDTDGVARNLALAAENARAAGTLQRAADLYLRAARSALAGPRQSPEALRADEWIRSAVTLARRVNEPYLEREGQELLRLVEETAPTGNGKASF